MSLYPPRTVVGIRATRRRDILEERWRHWQNIVDGKEGRQRRRATKLSIGGLSAAFEPGPALDVRALPQDEIRGHARIAVRKVFRDATSADSTPARKGRAGAPGSSMRTEITSRWCRARLRGGRLRSPRWRRARPARP